MRIGIDAHMLGDHSGGNETFYTGILDNLETNDGNEYFLFLNKGSEKKEYRERFNVIFLKSKNAFFRTYLELPKLCYQLKLDVLHTQYYLPFLVPCKKVVTIHDISFEHYKSFFNKTEYIKNKILVSYSAKKADQIVTVSKFSKKDIMQKYNVSSKKISVVHNAVDSVFRKMTLTEIQQSGIIEKYNLINVVYIACISNLQPRKNIEGLIKAFYFFKRNNNSPLKLIIIGKKAWKFKKIFKLTEKSDISKDIIFTGYVSKLELVALLNKAKGFVYPSFFEGFGIPPLEAQKCGLNVAVSDIPVMHEVLEESAIYFNPKSYKSISEEIAKFLDEKIKKINTKSFSWKESCKELKKVYKRI